MDAHEAMHRMIDAYKTQNLAMQYCDNSTALSLMADVRDTIYAVGEKKFGKEFISTLRNSQID
jgi:hypothetical protein